MAIPFYVAPDQMVQDKAEYARKGIAKGKSIVAMESGAGITLVAENPSASLNKISEIYDRIAFAGVGKYSEFENLRKAGIRYYSGQPGGGGRGAPPPVGSSAGIGCGGGVDVGAAGRVVDAGE